jgi:hypothetical protein
MPNRCTKFLIVPAVWRFYKHEGITFKKSLHASEQDRPDVARRRQWKKYQHRLDPRRLVFIDETWAKTNMTRRGGRSRRGTRLVAKAPRRRWRTLTFLAALRCDRIEAPCDSKGAPIIVLRTAGRGGRSGQPST